MAERTKELVEITVAPEPTASAPAVVHQELVAAQVRQADALVAIAEALSPARIQETLAGFAKAQAVGQLAAAMLGAANKNGLDARTYGRIETETAHLLGKLFDKAQEHLASGGGSTKADVDPETRDAEEAFKQWMEDDGA